MNFKKYFIILSAGSIVSCASFNKSNSLTQTNNIQTRSISSVAITPTYNFNDLSEQAYAYRGYMGFCAHPNQIPMNHLADVQNGMRNNKNYSEDEGDTLSRFLAGRTSFVQTILTGAIESGKKSYSSEIDANIDDWTNAINCRVIIRAKDYINRYGCYNFNGESVISNNSAIFQSCNTLLEKLKPFFKDN